MQWLEDRFLGYLKEWDKSVRDRKGFTAAEMKMMCLSDETLNGLRMTGIIIHTCISIIADNVYSMPPFLHVHICSTRVC